MMPRQQRARLLLRGLAKFLAVVIVAGAVGTLLGIGISELTGDDDEPGTALTPDTTSPTPEPSPGAAVSDSTTTTPAPASEDPLEQINVTVLSAVLHPVAGRRGRARLGVKVKVRNPGAQRVVLPRASLLTARQRIAANVAAGGSGMRRRAVNAAQAVNVTLQFDTAGAATRQLTTQKRARILVGLKSAPVTVTVGTPVQQGSGSSDNFFR